MKTFSFRRTLCALLCAALFLLGGGSPAPAHEVMVLPQKSGDFGVYVGGPNHLSFAAVDFGEDLVNSSTARTVALTNVNRRPVTVVPSAPAGMTVSPATLSLAAAGEPGAAGSLQLTYTRSVAGPFSGTVDLAVSHIGVKAARVESIPFLGTAVTPPRLKLSVPALGLDDIHRVDLGLMSNREHDPAEFPSIDVVVTNTGGSTAYDLKLRFLELVITVPTLWGDCGATSVMTLCVLGEGDLDPDRLGDLAAGGSLVTTWTLIPFGPGDFDPVLRFDTSDPAVSAELEVVTEVIPFTLPPGIKFLTNVADAAGHFGTTSDPLAEDPLAELRPKSFDARTVFSVGEIDTVDLRAGNLTVVIPIGGEIQARGPLSYSLQAVYNSDLWHRKSIDTIEPDGPAGKAVPLSGEWPDPLYNLRGGWAFHLGRLLPPNDWDGTDATTLCQSADPLGFERDVDTGPRFVYVDPTGTQHEFWAHLHGDEPSQIDSGWMPAGDVPVSYSRDGSYLRMVEESAGVRWIEESGGLRRRFQKLTTLHESLPDRWLLTRIEDRHGNAVTLSYGYQGLTPVWTLSDDSGYRQVVVKFQDWSGRKSDQPMLVSQVVLPGFGGAADRSFQFQYTVLTLNRPGRSGFHSVAQAHCPSLDTSLRVPKLNSITLPDGKSWVFTYSTGGSNDDLRMVSVAMPTGGKIDYTYAAKIWDSPPECNKGASHGHPGVNRRIVRDVGGGVLEDVRYLRQVRRTDDIPFGYCAVQRTPGHQARPWAEQVVGVWRDLGTSVSATTSWESPPASSLQLHYFNVWPYSASCHQGMAGCVLRDGIWQLKSGRTLHERNMMISHSREEGGLHLSSEVYGCSTGLAFNPGWDDLSGELPESPNPYAGDRLHLLADNVSRCERQEEKWAHYEVSLAGNCPGRETPWCLRDSRLVTEKTVFKNDGGRFRRLDKSDYDGLGHYRKEVTTGSWTGGGQSTPPPRTAYRRYNPGAGTLLLGPNHRVTQNIAPPSVWTLETWDRHYLREEPHSDQAWSQLPEITRGGEACFDSTTGHLKAARTWRCDGPSFTCSTASEGGSLTTVRSGQDVVVRRDVNTRGEVLHERSFGADTFNVTTGNDWCTQASGWSTSQQDQGVDFTYQFGQVATERVQGASTFETNRTVDQGTGWTKETVLASGELVDFTYDPMGRMTTVVSDRTASFGFAYETLAAGRRQLRAKVFPRGTVAGTPIRTYLARYDGLGRLWQEDLPRAAGGTVTRTITYDRGGRINKVTSLDAPTLASIYLYDYRGRPLLEKKPDGSNIEYQHFGERKTRRFTCVATDDTSGLGPTVGPCRNTGQKAVETEILKDFFGRVLRVQQADGSAGTQTSFLYQPTDKRLFAERKDLTSLQTQKRRWSFDGLGNLLREQIPERVDSVFASFDTRGNARRMTTGTRVTDFAFDELSRLRSVTVAGLEVKSFNYFTSGWGNGNLRLAVRRHRRDPIYTQSLIPGRYDVVSDFTYDNAGRRSSRRTWADWWEDGAASALRLGDFQQGWSYDDLGNVVRIDHPTCLTSTSCADDTFSETLQYNQGFFLTGVGVAGSTMLGATLSYHPSGVVHQVIHQGAGGTDVYGVAAGMPRIASMNLAGGTARQLNLGAVTYDGTGNILSIGGETFSYDRHSRLVASTVRGPSGLTSKNYTYDAFDNRTSPFAADPATNRIAGWPYDPFGNLTAAGNHTVAYDELDKVIAISYPQGPGPNGEVLDDVHQIALYDHDDLRIVRWNKNDIEAPLATWTLRDGLRVIRELDGTGPGISTRADFVYAGSRLIASRRYTGLGFPLGTERHYHQDQVGTSRLITGTDGHEVFTQPFGVPVGGVTSGERTVGFQGHETDGATTYMRGRQYYPGAGRFVQVDPGRDTGAWSLYAFGANSPTNFVDPDGKAVQIPFIVKAIDLAVNIGSALGFGIDKYSESNTVDVDNLDELQTERSYLDYELDAQETDMRMLQKDLEVVKEAEGGGRMEKFRLIRRSMIRTMDESKIEEQIEEVETQKESTEARLQAVQEQILELKRQDPQPRPEPESN